MWLRPVASSPEAAIVDHLPWTPAPTPSGHFAPVSDLKVIFPDFITLLSFYSILWQWSRDGSYLVSVSEDQTARTWAFGLRGGVGQGGWREIARPQVIFFFLQKCLALVLPFSAMRTRFRSLPADPRI
jgi:hypothetical protein